MAVLRGFDTKQAVWLATLALVALPLTGPGLAHARADTDTPCPSHGLVSSGDFDGDGVSDVAVGVPNDASSAGAADIHLSSGSTQRIRLDSPHAGDKFGSTVLQVPAGTETPYCTGLIVAAPGWHSGWGELAFYVETAGGLVPGCCNPTLPGHAGTRFGSAVALGKDGLYVGAPGATVHGHQDAGAVYVFPFTPGDTTFTTEPEAIITQDSAGIPGTAEAGDEFGATMATTFSGVVIGSPGESVGKAKAAGSITFITEDIPVLAQAWTQDSKGVPGTAEAGDHFGASLTGPFLNVLVGVPGEDVGHLKDAGQVQYFTAPNFGPHVFAPGPAATQDSNGVPGTAEAGDQFGASVGPQRGGFAVGAPGEDVGTVKDAGSVTLLNGTGLRQQATALTEGGIVGGAPAAEARFGAAVSERAGGVIDPEEGTTFDYLLVGAPGDDVAGIAGAGDVIDLRLDSSNHQLRRLADSAGPTSHGGYGAVLSYSETFS
jgi:hypothetical protein